MKLNIKNVSYNNKTKKVQWWVWDEYCDKCGKLRYLKGEVLHFNKPKNDKDYCLDCLNILLDEKLKDVKC